MKIITLNQTETAVYATEELIKYLRMMTPDIDDCGGEIRLGTLCDFELDDSDVGDPFVDDVVDIDITNAVGYIAGSNPRSILQGVYVYLKSAGCMFIRPGERGEYIPNTDMKAHSCKYRKKADYPFRGECCEGAISYEHMRDTVCWLPKVGMNMYMIEGPVPYTYMHKWYGHVGNRYLREAGQITDYRMLEEYIEKLEQDIRKVGVQFHSLGHGWMFEKLGIHHLPGNIEAQLLKEEHKKYLAQVNGVRGLYKNSTFFTHFCYSSPEARQILVDFCVEYAKGKPYVDFLHLWLADTTNNQCECGECVKRTPSDWYVILLNEIDEAFTREGLDTRIVFIMYVDTVRPPVTERLKNKNRFTLLAAIGSQYERGYEVGEYTGEIPPYERNNYTRASTELYMRWYREWRELCGVEGFIFEYRFYTDHYCDPGHMRITRETYRDMRSLEAVGFSGCMNDQTHRVYMPTSLPVTVMGETLFDRSLDLDFYTKRYFDAAFGEDGEMCRAYLERLSELFCPASVRHGGKLGVEDEGIVGADSVLVRSWINNPDVAEKTALIPSVLAEFLPVIEKNCGLTDPVRRLSWVYLKYHSEICSYLCRILNLGAVGDMDGARRVLDLLENYLSAVEPEIHPAFDLFLFVKYVRAKLDMKMVGYYD